MSVIEKRRKLEQIQQRVVRFKAEKWMIFPLARKLQRFFPDNAIEVVDQFAEHGWNASDLYHWLQHSPTFNRANPQWAAKYTTVFTIESLLLGAGLSKETSHSLVITQAWVFNIDPSTLQNAVRTLVNLRYGEDVIRSIANKMPHLFHLGPNSIVQECVEATGRERGLLWNANLNWEYANKTPPVIVMMTDSRPLTTRKIAIPAPVRTKTVATEPPAKPQMRKAVSKQAEEAKPLQITRRAVRQILEEDPTSTGNGLDFKRLKALVELGSDYDDSAGWEKFLEAHPWLKNPDSNEHQACVTLLLWVPLNFTPAQHHLECKADTGKRCRFWRSILLEDQYAELFTMPEEILLIRMFVLRRLERDFIKEPAWLLKTWEKTTEAELRYRCNLIDAVGKKPKLKPYINMLLEPDREKFKRRLTRFLESRAKPEPLYTEPDDESLIYDSDEAPPKVLTSDELKARLLARKTK